MAGADLPAGPAKAVTASKTTDYVCDGYGRKIQLMNNDGQSRRVDLLHDSTGQIIQRSEVLNAGGAAPLDYYYFGNAQVGHVSNNGAADFNYARSIANHDVSIGLFGPQGLMASAEIKSPPTFGRRFTIASPPT